MSSFLALIANPLTRIIIANNTVIDFLHDEKKFSEIGSGTFYVCLGRHKLWWAICSKTKTRVLQTFLRQNCIFSSISKMALAKMHI